MSINFFTSSIHVKILRKTTIFFKFTKHVSTEVLNNNMSMKLESALSEDNS